MPAYQIKERLVPYRVLAYLLYASADDTEWLANCPGGVKVTTGPMARALRLKVTQLWETLYWLEAQGLVEKIEKEQKRGTAVVLLNLPRNVTHDR